MVKVPTEIMSKLKKFALKLEQDNISIEQMYLFGSYAAGTAQKYSDIDVAVVSKDFSGIKYNDYDRFANAVIYTDVSIEPIAFTPENTKNDLFFISEIESKGIRII